jgi:hypothetical protein
VALSTAAELAPDAVRRWLCVHEELVHVSVEINRLA